MKVALLQEIAIEYSIKWDAKCLEQRLYTPPPTHHHAENPKTKANYNPGKTSSLSFHVREESLDDKSISKRREDDSMMIRSKSCVTGPEEEEEDPENKPFYNRFIMSASYKINNKPKIEKQESLPEKMTKSDLMPKDTDDCPSDGKAKPRSVRRRLANPPPSDGEELVSSKKMMRTDEWMEKASGEGMIRRMSRRTASWQSNVPDFDEVAARVDALTRN
ncbi:hypothetical protein Bca4012_103847 [Brassica carinata]